MKFDNDSMNAIESLTEEGRSELFRLALVFIYEHPGKADAKWWAGMSARAVIRCLRHPC